VLVKKSLMALKLMLVQSKFATSWLLLKQMVLELLLAQL